MISETSTENVSDFIQWDIIWMCWKLKQVGNEQEYFNPEHPFFFSFYESLNLLSSSGIASS